VSATTEDRVTAQFGTLGELDYRFAPKRHGHVDCNGAEEGESVSSTTAGTGRTKYLSSPSWPKNTMG
jgi:hypothetical protein